MNSTIASPGMKERPLLKDSENSLEKPNLYHKSTPQTQQSDILAFLASCIFQSKMIPQNQPELSRFMKNSKQRGEKGI